MNQMPPQMPPKIPSQIPPQMAMGIPPHLASMHNMSVPPPIEPNALTSLQQVPMMQNQINMIKEQIQQSEKNLSAQREMFKVKTKRTPVAML